MSDLFDTPENQLALLTERIRASLSASSLVDGREVYFPLDALIVIKQLIAGLCDVNKAPHHMSVEETDLIRLCDEYEVRRARVGHIGVMATQLCALELAEHFELIRRAVHRAV